MWSGGGNVSTMEWFVVGLEATAIETATETTSVVLTLTPDDDGLDGTMLLCRVTLSTGQEAEETITLSVQGMAFCARCFCSIIFIYFSSDSKRSFNFICHE